MELTEAGKAIFYERYAARDERGEVVETPEEAVRRIARAAAMAEKKEERAKWEEEFARVIGERYFIPSTPIWANLGKDDRPWQPAACFVLDIEDSLESMYQTLKDTALVCKSGGGVGFNFSKIRPQGDLIRSTKGRASGVVKLIELYNASGDMIKQGGVRRGAFMAILNCDHPEIFEFVRAKRKGGLENFNLAVGVFDSFMEAVRYDWEWDLQFKGEVRVTVPARQLWQEIVEAAWETGEPGLIFLDRLRESNPVPRYPIEATNPCVTADTWVTTSEGPRQVKELVGRPFVAIVNGRPYSSCKEGFFKTATREVVNLFTKEGYGVRLTPEHRVQRVVTASGSLGEREWVEVKELKPGDKISLNDHRLLEEWPGPLSENEGYLLGKGIGNGAAEEELLTFVSQFASQWEDFGLGKELLFYIERASSAGGKGFLRGLFESRGGIRANGIEASAKAGNNGYVFLSLNNLEVLRVVQRMLLRLGIVSMIAKTDEVGKTDEEIWQLLIGRDSLAVFAKRVGFSEESKKEELNALLAGLAPSVSPDLSLHTDEGAFLATVLAVEAAGVEEVYDVQIPGINAFDANGIYAHNCGEQPLSAGESCLLGSINLARMVSPWPFSSGGIWGAGWEIDWERLTSTIQVAVRFLDNCIEVGEYPLPFIAERTRATRKIGLGVLGLHDLLLRCEMPYDSMEGRQLAYQIIYHLRKTAYETSAALAEERGVFPAWEFSVYARRGEKMRNASCLTLAPTGTITLLAGAEGYGIEPIFAVAYRKLTRSGTITVFSPLFQEACERAGVPAAVMEEVAARGSCQWVRGIPPYIQRLFRGAREIDSLEHLAMQMILQQEVDNAISKTINLPASSTLERVSEIYLKAYEGKLKGITVFRECSRAGVIEVGGVAAEGCTYCWREACDRC